MSAAVSSKRFFGKPDLLTILIYFAMVLLGWLNIYAAVFDNSVEQSIFDLSLNSGRQLAWIAFTVLLVVLPLLIIDYRVFEGFSWPTYGFMIFLLILTLLLGREVAGSKSWITIGSFAIQPSEFAKFATALALANYLSKEGRSLQRFQVLLISAVLIALPAVLILLQNDTGSTLVYASFVILLYRAGLSGVYPTLLIGGIVIFVLTLLVNNVFIYVGIGLIAIITLFLLPKKTFGSIALTLVIALATAGTVKSVDYLVNDVLKPHQQNRIKALINPNADPLGYGWNVTQSKIAIGSGGLWGQGFLSGTQTKFDFVPEQSTDFIFCTIGEEHGWVGSTVVIVLFVALLLRLLFLAERQNSRFVRLYGYGVVGILFFHFMVNIGMTIGLMPVIGIPLPFFSYGGSSLLAFSILLFIFIKLDAHRAEQTRWTRFA